MHSATLFLVAFVCGCVLALGGYYYPGFRAGEIDLYRNVVVREGERIERLTNDAGEHVCARLDVVIEHEARRPRDAGAEIAQDDAPLRRGERDRPIEAHRRAEKRNARRRPRVGPHRGGPRRAVPVEDVELLHAQRKPSCREHVVRDREVVLR